MLMGTGVKPPATAWNQIMSAAPPGAYQTMSSLPFPSKSPVKGR